MISVKNCARRNTDYSMRGYKNEANIADGHGVACAGSQCFGIIPGPVGQTFDYISSRAIASTGWYKVLRASNRAFGVSRGGNQRKTDCEWCNE
jgi:hypothetical protein